MIHSIRFSKEGHRALVLMLAILATLLVSAQVCSAVYAIDLTLNPSCVTPNNPAGVTIHCYDSDHPDWTFPYAQGQIDITFPCGGHQVISFTTGDTGWVEGAMSPSGVGTYSFVASSTFDYNTTTYTQIGYQRAISTTRMLWVSDSLADIAVFRAGQWILDYGMDGTVNRRFNYGLASDIPIVGDFNNDGTTDSGVFRAGQWILDYGIDRTVNRRFNYGLATDIPIVGDFNNDGTTDSGVFRSGQWILDYGMDGTVNRRLNYGLATDTPLVGDFNNDGTTDSGVFRAGQWILDYGMDGTVNRRFPFGLSTDIPVVGDFNNDGTTDSGVFRSGQWILDYGMDGSINRRFNYGQTNDIPLAGNYDNA